MLYSTCISEDRALEFLDDTKANPAPNFSIEQVSIIRRNFDDYIENFYKVTDKKFSFEGFVGDLLLPYSAYENPRIDNLLEQRKLAYMKGDPDFSNFVNERTIRRFVNQFEKIGDAYIAAIRDFLVLVGFLEPRQLDPTETQFAAAFALDSFFQFRDELPEEFYSTAPIVFQAYEEHKNDWVHFQFSIRHIASRVFHATEQVSINGNNKLCNEHSYWLLFGGNTIFGYSINPKRAGLKRLDILQNYKEFRTPSLARELTLQRTAFNNLTSIQALKSIDKDQDKLFMCARQSSKSTSLILLKNKENKQKIENHKYFPYTKYYIDDVKRRDTTYIQRTIEMALPNVEEFFHLIWERHDESLRGNFNYIDSDQKIRLAIQSGFDVNARDPRDGSTALHIAAAFCDQVLTEILEQNPNIDYLLRDGKGKFPLDLSKELSPYSKNAEEFIAHLREKSFSQAKERGLLEEFAHYGHDNRDNAFPVWTPDANTP